MPKKTFDEILTKSLKQIRESKAYKEWMSHIFNNKFEREQEQRLVNAKKDTA